MTPHELRTRLALDAAIVARLRSPHLGAIHGYTSVSHLTRRERASDAELAGGRAIFWTVEYRLPMLAAPGRPLASATAVFNLLAGGDYPFSPPTVAFAAHPFPWCGHVHALTGTVCLGEGWVRARGQITLGHLIVHVTRLVNFDEPQTFDGFDAAALRYGRDVLHGRPLNPDLVYPALPADILHGVREEPDSPEPAATAFIPRTAPAPRDTGLFVPRPGVAASSAGLFLPRVVLR